MKRSLLWILLAAVLLYGAPSAFAGGKQEAGKGAAPGSSLTGKIPDATNVNPKGEYPIVKKPIKLTMALPIRPQIQDINTNKLSQWIEEKSGIDIVFTPLSATGADAQTQINLMFTSGQLPDLIWGYGFSYAAMSEYADAGYLVALDDCIKAYGDNYFNFLKEVAVKNAAAYVTKEGHVYAVPTCTELITNVYAGKIFRYQQEFADKLGIKDPDTLDDLYNMLVAFREKDPNGNGKKDEIPMMAFKDYVARSLSVLANCYQYTDPNTYLKVNNNTVSFVANNDLFKESVEFWRKLVTEGLFDPASFTQTAANQKTVNIQKDTLIGVDANGNQVSTVYDTTMERYFTMTTMHALKGPHGYVSTPLDPPVINRAMVMTKACKNPGAAYRLMDMMLSEEAAVRTRIGVKGAQWADAEKGVPGRDGAQSKYLLLTPQEWIQPSTNAIWDIEAVVYSNVMNHVSATKDKQGHWEVGYKAGLVCQSNLMKTVTGEHLPDLLFSVADSTAFDDLKKLITTYVMENMTKFILGDKPMSDWGAYVAQFDRMGLPKYVSYAQKSYDAMNK